MISKSFAQTLTHLGLADRTIDTKSMTWIISLSLLTVLDLSHCCLDVFDDDMQYDYSPRFRELISKTQLPNLKCLILQKVTNFNQSLITWCQAIKTLTSLDLSNSQHIYWKRLNDLPNLKYLNLSNSSVENSELDPFSILDLTKLTHLNLYHTEFDMIGSIDQLTKFTNLNELNFGFCDYIIGSDMESITYLTRITNLNLSHNDNLTDVEQILKLTNLTDLDLSSCSKITELSIRLISVSISKLTHFKYGF